MKASSLIESAIEKSIVIFALFSTLFLVYPETTVLAQGLQTQSAGSAQVFDINSKQNLNSVLPEQKSITMADIVSKNDLLAPELQAYLQIKGSPLATSAGQILTYNNWKRALAISFVESNMCKRTPKIRMNGSVVESHNCSGIAGGKRAYTSYVEWLGDMNALLNKPNYANRPIEKFLGYYVVPGSRNWLMGVKKVEADLTALEQKAEAQHLALVKGNNTISVATAGTPELVQK